MRFFFFFKQKTAYEIYQCDWSSDVCSSDLGYQSIETLAKYKKPLVWTMHDMWPFTGGCHYSDGCEKYETLCNACPALGSTSKNDLSQKIWKKKQKIWKHLDLHIVSPSHWLAECAKKSRLLENIPDRKSVV